MGVKGLFPFLTRVAPQCIQQVSIEALKGKKIAIDGNLLLYREYTSPWLPVTQPKKHILWAIRLMRLCREHHISPIVVFDSPETTPAKAHERVKRALRKEKDRESLRESTKKAERLQDLVVTMKAFGSLEQAQQEEITKEFTAARNASLETTSMHGDPTKKQKLQEEEEEEKQEDGKGRKPKKKKKGKSVEAQPGTEDVTIVPPEAELVVDDDVSLLSEEAVSSIAETAELVQRLLKHLRQILATDSHDSSSELALLLRLVKTGSGIPMAELQDLQAQTADLVTKLSRRVSRPRHKDIRKTCKYLSRYGIPVQISPDRFEGECTASYFTRMGYADCVATEDSDVLVYGVPQLRGFMSVHANSKGQVSLTEMKMVDPLLMRAGVSKSVETPWTESTFLDFAILCGTDFSTGIPGFGISRAHELMEKQRSIEKGVKSLDLVVIKSGPKKGESRFPLHANFETDAAIARGIFSTYPTAPGSLMDRLSSQHKVSRAFGIFSKLCENDKRWQELETKILTEEKLAAEDVMVLDNPDLYRLQPRPTSSIVCGVVSSLLTLNDDPDRASSGNDSGFLLDRMQDRATQSQTF